MNSAVYMLDTNVPMYAAGKAHPYKLPCAWVMHEVAEGHLEAVISTEIIQEVLYRYGGARQWDIAIEMATNLIEIVPAIYPVQLPDTLLCVKLCERYGPSGLPVRDLLHVAVMQNSGLDTIISTDTHFDHVQGITRLDPQVLYAKARKQTE